MPGPGAGGATQAPGVAPVLGGPGPGGPGGQTPVGGPGARIGAPVFGSPGYPGNTGPILPGIRLPLILTPGVGPNGPGPIDARKCLYSVGEQSAVPYGPTNGYAASDHGVTGFIGPAAGSLFRPVVRFVRASGSDSNGGDTKATTSEQSGSDGVVSASTGALGGVFYATFTSATLALTSAHVGRSINVNTRMARITVVASATSCTVAGGSTFLNGSSYSWAIGGALATLIPTFAGTGTAGGSSALAGDTTYVGAGVYRSTYTLNVIPYFNGVVSVVGDVTGQYTGDAGMVQLTAYTTNDKTAPSATTLLNLNGKSNLAFSNIMFVAGSGNPSGVGTANTGGQNVSFLDCVFLQGYTGVGNAGMVFFSQSTGSVNTPFNLLIDRCLFVSAYTGNGAAIQVTPNNSLTYGENVTIRNCQFHTPPTSNAYAIYLAGGQGAVVRNCFIFGGVRTLTSLTAIPHSVDNCFIWAGAGSALTASTLGSLVETFNLIAATTPRTNVNIGTGSISDGSYAPLFHFGQERIWLPPIPRYFGEPMANSPLLGFGNDGSQTGYDLRGVLNPRPAGGGSGLPAVGALERSDTFITDPSPIGPNTTPVKLTGPGYNDILLPIGVTEVGQARNVSVEVEYDSNYEPSQMNLFYPAIILVAKPQMGVTQQIVYAAAGMAGQVQTINLAPFTPTATGVLNLRLVSYDQTGVSVVRWDGMSVT